MPRGGARPGSGPKPGSVGKAKKLLIEQAKKAGPKMLAVLEEIALDPTKPPAARVSAAQTVLDRGFGRAQVSIALTDGEDTPATRTLGDFYAAYGQDVPRLSGPQADVVDAEFEDVTERANG